MSGPGDLWQLMEDSLLYTSHTGIVGSMGGMVGKELKLNVQEAEATKTLTNIVLIALAIVVKS